jgi:hypothetical protein
MYDCHATRQSIPLPVVHRQPQRQCHRFACTCPG